MQKLGAQTHRGQRFNGSSGRDCYHHFPELLTVRQSLECFACPIQWKHAIDYRSELSFAQPSDDFRVLGGVPHRGSEQTPVMPEQSPQIETHMRPGGRAHRSRVSPRLRQRSESSPRRGSHVFDYDSTPRLW